jgi:predicted nucleic acid-binding protein
MASEAVFADASFFFALAARRDSAHASAVGQLGTLLRGESQNRRMGWKIIIGSPILKAREISHRHP